MSNNIFQWSELAFQSKKPLKELKATFIAAPREISIARFIELIKQNLPQGNILVGVADEEYIMGYEGQPHFKTLALGAITDTVAKVNASKSPHKVYVLQYSQRDLVHILEKVSFKNTIFINGSWQYSLHTRPEYYVLVSQKANFERVSPFTSGNEAKKYQENMTPTLDKLFLPEKNSTYDEKSILHEVERVAKHSYDVAHQTGAAICMKHNDTYTLIDAVWNKVVPYETFALHNGPQRERHFSPPGDLNHYDTVHSEMILIINAQKSGYSLSGTTLFVNLLPCPTCARAICLTDIKEVVYTKDHSGGYAIGMLEASGKKVRRVIDLASEL